MSQGMSAGGSRRRMAQAYANVGLETQVMGSSPEHLITLLLQGALAAISKARLCLNQQDAVNRGLFISKAIDIVDSGLKSSINTEAGGSVSENLIASYDLIIRYLLQANLESNENHLTTAETMLTNILDAWRSAVDVPGAATA